MCILMLNYTHFNCQHSPVGLLCCLCALFQCPESLQNSLSSPSSSTRSRSAFDRSDAPHDVTTERSLARLHRRLIVAIQRHSCTNCQWAKHMNSAMELEDLAENQASTSRVFRSSTGMYSGRLKSCHSPVLGVNLEVLLFLALAVKCTKFLVFSNLRPVSHGRFYISANFVFVTDGDIGFYVDGGLVLTLKLLELSLLSSHCIWIQIMWE